ncbi:MAG: nuclear transport factor 2 family protein [Leptolyngbya sp. BL-A-14]
MIGNSTEPDLSHLIVPDGFFANRPLIVDGQSITADDRFALLDLVHSFEWCLVSRHKEAFAKLFTDDVVFDHGVGYARGQQAAVDLAWQVPFYGLRHHFANQVPYIDDQGRLAMLSHMFVIQVDAEQPMSQTLPLLLDQGVLHWVFQKQSDRWKVAELVFDQQKLATSSGAPESMIRAMSQTAAQRAIDRAKA